MKASEIKTLTDEQLVHLELELERKLLSDSMRHRLGKLENTSMLGKTRKDVARAQTEITGRESGEGISKGALRARHAGSFVPAARSAGSDAGGGFLKGILDTQEASE